MTLLAEHDISTTYKNADMFYGIDIGGTKIEIGIFSSDLTLVDSWRTQTPTTNYSDFLKAIVTLVNDANLRYSQTGHVGIGMPGIIDKNGLVKSANVPCATGKNIKEDLSTALTCDISIGNDCRLFALSEAIGGAGHNFDTVFGAIIGTGAAGGLCLGGHIFNGRSGFAGEYGHIPASAYLIDKYKLPVLNCGCGLKGCYESYVAGPGLGWLYENFGSKTRDTHHFVQQLNENEPIATKTFDCYMNLLGASFVSIILSYDPDVIVLGGGISKIDKVVEMLPYYVDKHLFSGIDCPPIIRAKYGDSSGVRGAAILRRQLLEK